MPTLGIQAPPLTCAGLFTDNTHACRELSKRARSDSGKKPPDEQRRNRPARAREEAYAEPDTDLVEVDGGRHVRVSLW